MHRLCIAVRVGDVAVHRRWFGCARRVPPRAGSHTRRTASMSPVIRDAPPCFVPCTACASVITAGGSSWRRRGDLDATRKAKVSCTTCVSRVCSLGFGRVRGLPGRWARPWIRFSVDVVVDLRAVGPRTCLTTRSEGCQRGLGEGGGAWRALGGRSSSIGAPQGAGDTEFALHDPLGGPRDALRGVDMPRRGPWTTVSCPGGGPSSA